MDNNQKPAAEAQIKSLLQQLRNANHQVAINPLETCKMYVDIIKQAGASGSNAPSELSVVFQRILETASDNLIQASLLATTPDNIEDVVPLFTGKMNRLNNLLNLGYYLLEHEIQVEIDGKIYTAANCAAAAHTLEPQNPMVQKLVALAEHSVGA